MIQFASPWWGLLLVPLGISLWLGRNMIRGMARRRKAIATVLRGLLYASLVLALMGPILRRPNQGTCTVFLVDRSDSIQDEARRNQEQFLDEALGALPDGDVAAVVAFGANAMIESAPGPRRSMRKIESKVEASNSDLAGAVRLGSALFPPGKAKRLVVLSDGNETKGELRSAASAAKTDDITIDFVSMGSQKATQEALVTGIELPDSGRENQPFDLKVNIESKGIRSGILTIDRDGVLVERRAVNLQEGTNSVLLRQTVKNVGLVRYRATLQANGDTDPRNNVGAGFVNVVGRPKVLLCQATTKDQSLFNALVSKGISVDLVTPGNLPSRPEQLQGYESVLLNDINATMVNPSLQQSFVTACRDSGIGLGMIGGENSFLPGGWYGSVVTDALPVDLNIRQKKSLAAASVFIIADCSGSMGAVEDGVPKVKLAARAAEETIKLLGPMDRVGVAGSSSGIEIVAPMQSAANKEEAINGARKLDVSGGGIFIRPSILKAEEVLRNEPSKTRHFILLADGADSTDWQGVFETAVRMRAQKITTSVVAIGDGGDVPNLKKLAAIGGGRFYLAIRANQLPAIFTQDTAVMSRSAIEEGAFLPKVTQLDESIQGALDGGIPPLLAYCLTEPKPLAKTILKTKKDDPLLLHGRAGLGQTLAFTSDAQARWAKQWVGWEGFATFWAQQVRAIGRQATKNSYEVKVSQAAGKSKVTVIGKDPSGNPLSAPETPIKVGAPDGTSQELSLLQVAPGTYEGEFSLGATGSYIVSVVESDGGGGSRVHVAGTSVAYPPEYRVLNTNSALLNEVAKSTGGKEITKPQEINRKVAIPGESLTEMWSFFLSLAIVLLPLDIANRRISVPFWKLFERKPKSQSTSQSAQTIQSLRKVKLPKNPVASKPVATILKSVDVPKVEEPPTDAESIQESAGSALLQAKKKRQGD